VNAYIQKHEYANATAEDFWDAQAKTSKKPVDKIMPTWVKQPGVPMVNVKAQCSGKSTNVSVSQKRYYFDRTKFEAGNDQLWEIPLCLKGSATENSAGKRHRSGATYLAAAFRYTLIGLALYAIFELLHVSLVSLAVGLCAFAAAIITATVWEIIQSGRMRS